MNSRLPVCLLLLASLLASQLTLAHHLVEHIHALGAAETHVHSLHEAHQAHETHQAHQAHSAPWADTRTNVTAVAEEADHADVICAICLMYSAMQGCASQPESFPVAPMVGTTHPPPPAFLRVTPRCASRSIRAPPTL